MSAADVERVITTYANPRGAWRVTITPATVTLSGRRVVIPGAVPRTIRADARGVDPMVRGLRNLLGDGAIVSATVEEVAR